jgi:hypothetical protein
MAKRRKKSLGADPSLALCSTFLGEVHVENFLPKKLRNNPVVFPFDFFYRYFGRFSA